MKTIHANFTTKTTSYQLFLPINIEILIPEDDSVRLLSAVMDQLDYIELEKAYSRKGRKGAVTPQTLFKILVYGYMNGIYTSRSIEKACQRDINFMWLLQGNKAPDHNTIARFRKNRVSKVIEGLFYQLVHWLHNHQEIDFENLFVDGTKIEAQASRYSFTWRKTVEKNLAKLRDKLGNILVDYGVEFTDVNLHKSAASLLKELTREKKAKKITFVYGIGKRKTNLQRKHEELTHLLERHKKYQECLKIFNGRNSYSKTDTDATFMRMKEDHMRNGQLKPGYNVQLGVEAEYIVGVDISSERSDALALIPLLKRMDRNLAKRHSNVATDAGYESEENYTYLERKGQISYIKPMNYEKSKKRNYTKFEYDHKADEYTCKVGRKLTKVGERYRKSKSGYKSRVSIYKCMDCSGCEVKSTCTKASGDKRLEASRNLQRQREISLSNIKSKKGILLRMNRSIQVEGAFGILKEDYGFRRFLTRGEPNVRTEMLFLALAYNLNKLHNKSMQKRNGQQLHKEVA